MEKSKKQKKVEQYVQNENLIERHNKEVDSLSDKLAMTMKENTILKRDNEELAKTINKLKFSIGGYTTSVAKQKKEISTLKGIIEETKLVVKGLLDEKKELESEINKQRDLNREINGTAMYYKTNYEHFLSLPWYKRFFVIFMV